MRRSRCSPPPSGPAAGPGSRPSPTCPPRRHRSALGALFAAFALTALPARAPADDKVGEFLDRHGLTELHALHLEQQLARLPAVERLPLARKLADLLAAHLLAVT